MNPPIPTAWVLLLSVVLGGCEAGPSAFDRSGAADSQAASSIDGSIDGAAADSASASGDGLVDTVDLANLPSIPRAVDVETLQVVGDDTLLAEPSSPTAAGESVAGLDGPEGPGTSDPSAGIGPLGFRRPPQVRGIYLNAWAAGARGRVDALIDLARRTEINTFVIDIKDASGYVSHRTEVPLAHEIGATEEVRIRDLPGLLRRLRAEGIYPVARIVIVKDPLLSAARPDLTVRDSTGAVFVDKKGIVWLNPYNRGVWEYHLDLAREVADLGFPEVQWDYVRFPDISAEEKERVVYLGSDDEPKADAIHDFLAYSRDALTERGVRVTADVFGVTTSASRDIGIGQVWESVASATDVVLPMVYPSHYWEGSFGFTEPNAHPYEIVKRALEDAVRRSEAMEGDPAVLRPWLQDFSLGQPPYGPAEVRAQIQATYDAGAQEWVLWNPGSHYTEEALEPVGGFPDEPEIRIGGRVVPVSARWAVIDSVRAARASEAAAEAAGDSLASLADSSEAPDSTGLPGRSR